MWGTKVYLYIISRIGLVLIIYLFGFQSNAISYFILAYFFIITFHFWSSPPIQDRWVTTLRSFNYIFCILMFLLSLVISFFLLKLSLNSFIFSHYVISSFWHTERVSIGLDRGRLAIGHSQLWFQLTLSLNFVFSTFPWIYLALFPPILSLSKSGKVTNINHSFKPCQTERGNS